MKTPRLPHCRHPLVYVLIGLALLGLGLLAHPPIAHAETITVTNTLDSGAGTLRQAVAEAAPGDTIVFDDSLSGLTITLTSTLEITQDLTLDGSTLPISITLSDNGAARILRASNNARVTLDSLTLAHGHGLKIEAGATVTLTHSAVLSMSNTQNDRVVGGGIENYGVLTVTDTILAGNQSLYEGGWGGGGAIYNEGTLRVFHSTFANNHAQRMGGALFSMDGSVWVADSTFINNTALSSVGVWGWGGALFIDSDLHNVVVSITHSTFANNVAGRWGGAIDIWNSGNMEFQIADSTFADNSARLGGAIDIAESIFPMHITIVRSVFSHNSASESGGAIEVADKEDEYPLQVSDSIFTGNSAELRGGAINFWLGRGVVQNSVFVGNQVTSPDGWGGGGIGSQGGAGRTILQVENSTFSGNGAASAGGGIALAGSAVHLTNVTLADNVAPVGAGIAAAAATTGETLYYTNTVIVNNWSGNGVRGADCALSEAAAIRANVNNLVADGSCSAGGVNFLSGDPRLGPLTDLGGPRAGVAGDVPLPVHPLRLASPALDSGDPTYCPATDQRGVVRPQGAGCDRGAYELDTLHLALAVTPATNAPLGGLVTCTLILTNTGGVADPAVALTGTLPAGLAFEAWLNAPPNSTIAADTLHWQGSVESGATRTWQFTARNTGAFDQPGEYGDMLLTTALVSGATDPGNWDDATVVVECGPDPLQVQTRRNSGACSLRQILADAPTGATVTFRPELAGQTILLAYPKDRLDFLSWLVRQEATLVITRDVTVDGSALATPVILDGNNESRIFLITDAAHVTLDDLTLTHGWQYRLEGGQVGDGGAVKIAAGAALTLTHSRVLSNTDFPKFFTTEASGHAGGIANFGQLTVLYSDIVGNLVACSVYGGSCGGGILASEAETTIAYSRIMSNTAVPHDRYYSSGGGISNRRSNLTMSHCLIAGNQAYEGAGLWNTGLITVSDSAFIDNFSPLEFDVGWGGGIYIIPDLGYRTLTSVIRNSTFSGNRSWLGGAICDTQPLSLTHNTIAGNYAKSGHGGGIFYNGAVPAYHFQNIIALNNTAVMSDTDCMFAGNVYYNFTANVNNLVGDGTCSYGAVGFLTGDPRLGPLGDHGGPRIGPDEDIPLPTFALLPDSPAIDTATALTCTLPTDQRGEPRNDLGNDRGAFELQYADSDTVIRPVSSTLTTTFGPALVGIQRDASFADPGVITVTKEMWSTHGPESIAVIWDITPTVTSGFSLTLQLCYSDAELGSLDEETLRFWRDDGGGWAQVGDAPELTMVNGYHCAALSGVETLSRWTLSSGGPTAVEMAWFTAAPRDGAIVLVWETASEIDLLGFHLYRAETVDGPRMGLTEALLPGQAPGSPVGARYEFVDETAVPGVTYWYWLADVDVRGAATLHGPVSAAVPAGEGYRVYLPVVRR